MTLLNQFFKRKQSTFFDLNQNNIYPWVKVIYENDNEESTSPQIELTDDDSPVFKHWLANLAIFYAIDMGESFHLLQKRNLPKNISMDILHQLSIRNLNGKVGHQFHDCKDGWKLLAAGGDHEAGFICVPYIWKSLAHQMNDDLIVAIPAKDLVLIVPKSDRDKVSNLKSFVHDIFEKGDRLLTKSLFKFDKGTNHWEVFNTSD